LKLFVDNRIYSMSFIVDNFPNVFSFIQNPILMQKGLSLLNSRFFLKKIFIKFKNYKWKLILFEIFFLSFLCRCVVVHLSLQNWRVWLQIRTSPKIFKFNSKSLSRQETWSSKSTSHHKYWQLVSGLHSKPMISTSHQKWNDVSTYSRTFMTREHRVECSSGCIRLEEQHSLQDSEREIKKFLVQHIRFFSSSFYYKINQLQCI